jgi:hypothetical protein
MRKVIRTPQFIKSEATMSEAIAVIIFGLVFVLLFAGMIWGIFRCYRWVMSATRKRDAEFFARRIADVEDAYEVERRRRDRSEEE